MPRYHFNLSNGHGPIPDEEGRELAGLEEARAEALKGARSIMAEEMLEGRLDFRGVLEIADERGEVLHRLRFEDAVDTLR